MSTCAEQWSKFAALSVMVTSPKEWTIIELDEISNKQTKDNKLVTVSFKDGDAYLHLYILYT